LCACEGRWGRCRKGKGRGERGARRKTGVRGGKRRKKEEKEGREEQVGVGGGKRGRRRKGEDGVGGRKREGRRRRKSEKEENREEGEVRRESSSNDKRVTHTGQKNTTMGKPEHRVPEEFLLQHGHAAIDYTDEQPIQHSMLK